MIGSASHEKPKGGHFDKMVGPGAWPETDESAFVEREALLGGIHAALAGAKEGWQSGQSYLKSEALWSGKSAAAATSKIKALRT